jgi:hypothetical protein
MLGNETLIGGNGDDELVGRDFAGEPGNPQSKPSARRSRRVTAMHPRRAYRRRVRSR